MNFKDKYDFFDDDEEMQDFQDIPEKKVIVETPEEKEEKEIANDTIRRGYNRLRLILYSIVAILGICFATWLWIRYFHPYTAEAQETGRIMQLKVQGVLFNTYEGILLSEKYVDFPEKWLEYDFPFSVVNDSIARKIMSLQGTGIKVRLTYEEYQGTLPWRGNSHRIITGYEIIETGKQSQN